MFTSFIVACTFCASALPVGSAPAPVDVPHFPDKVHAFVWRNWQLVPAERMAGVLGTGPAEVLQLGEVMGLAPPPAITADQQRRSYITVIRRNWHLLPYEQLLQLLGWTAAEMEFTLQEDDFLYVKLGLLKPKCPPLKFAPPDEAACAREAEIKNIVRQTLGDQVGQLQEPLFDFVRQLSTPPDKIEAAASEQQNLFDPRYCSSYFALYGDPLLDRDATPYPDGYLARLAQAGANGVWLQAVLFKLHPFPWDATLSIGHDKRLDNLRDLVARARQYGIGVYLYLNEPRSMPLEFVEAHPKLRGVTEGERAALCTSAPEVQHYIRDAVTAICQAVPDLAGFFTITGSENLTNCWSHGQGGNCPHCGPRGAATVVAEVNAIIQQGIDASGAATRLIAWDWGWGDDWAPEAIRALPPKVSLMSVSEWSLPITRGGVESTIGEYSISAIGPGPRARKHWQVAREHGLKTLAKIQAGNTWELSAVPYIPAVARVAQHALNLRGEQLDGIMLGWTLGGYPSPNLEVVKLAGLQEAAGSVEEILQQAAAQLFDDPAHQKAAVQAWQRMSEAFGEFPYNGGTVYSAPLQAGPSNLLWGEPTGYHASMVGIPYDDVDAWRSIYPAEVFAAQLEKVAAGFREGAEILEDLSDQSDRSDLPDPSSATAIESEIRIARTAAAHFQSVANQVRFTLARNALAQAAGAERGKLLQEISTLLDAEVRLAKELYEIQIQDSRMGFEASNQYFYVPLDLAEKIINCEYLKTHWRPEQATE
ncbi:MAG: hypothetical protein HYV26_14370 [Candidatus Hydrogenedentes bacterium]|nr:hypothetical protein [Candidatus Hydrogenedentota bacterium]